jgi:hypothetical protein
VGDRRLLCQNRERGENGRGVRSDAKWRVKKGGGSLVEREARGLLRHMARGTR